jgi:sugar porter (SP) family MFS transporter
MAGGGGMAGAPMTASWAAQMNSKPNLMTYLSITIVMMGALMFGIDQTNYGLVHGKASFGEFWCPKFDFEEAKGHANYCSEIGALDAHLQPAKWSMFISLGLNMVTIGMAVSCLSLAPFLARKCGRRLTISVGGLTCFFGCVIVSFLSNNVAVYMLGRFVTGYGVGIACYCLPMYQAEVATMGIRGLMGAFFQLMVAIGCFVTVPIMSVVDDWKQGFLLPGYAGLLVGLAVWLCPESPRFVIDRFGKDAGRPVLQRVRRGDVEAELEFVAKNLEEEKQAGSVAFKELFTKPGLRLRVFTACYLAVAQQFTGINAFLGFQTDIFKAAGADADKIDSLGGPAMMFQVTMMIGCILGLILIDSRFGGRRKQLIGAAAFMGPALFIGSVALWANWSSQISLIALFVFGFGFQLAWGIVPWFYPAEIFTMREKESALSLSTCSNFAANVVVNQIAMPLMRFSPPGTFLIFAVLNITNVVFVLACVKETKGVPLEDIPAMFGAVDSKDSKHEPLRSV